MIGSNHCLKILDHYLKKIISNEKIAWIEVDGFPLCSWGIYAFKKVDYKWGT